MQSVLLENNSALESTNKSQSLAQLIMQNLKQTKYEKI